MRTKNAIYNNLAAAILQMTILIFGLILPRLIIETYGSQLNGLYSSTKQVVSYLKYLELGITSALVYTLYQPLAKKKYDDINPIVTRAKKEYSKISLGYLVGVVLLSLIYPLLLKEDLGYGKVLVFIFLIGIYGAIDFYSLSKYQVLLEADQKSYIINIITIITTILQNVTSILLIVFNQSILLVAFVPTVFLPIRSIFLRLYIKNKYKEINYDVNPSEDKMEIRKDAFISGLGTSLNISLPVVIVSLMVSLEMASVFSIYNMVFAGLIAIVSVFISGMRAGFGNMFAREEIKNIIRVNDYFEMLFSMLITILFSSALVLIIPFITVYVGDAADINYIYPIMGVLFTIWAILHNARIPNNNIINASGNWKLTTKTNILQVIVLLISTMVLGYLFEVNGVLVGMIISSLYKTIAISYISNKKVLNISNKKSFLRLIRIFVVVVIIYLPIALNLLTINPNNLLSWAIWAIVIVIAATLITLIVNALFDSKVMSEIFNTYIKKIFKSRRKNKKI